MFPHLRLQLPAAAQLLSFILGRSAELSTNHCFQFKYGMFLCFPASSRYSNPMTQMLKKEKRKVFRIQVAWSEVAGKGSQSRVLCSEFFCLGFRICVCFQVGDLGLEFWVVFKVNVMLFVRQLKSPRLRRAVKAEGGCWLCSGGSAGIQALRERLGEQQP